MLCTVLKTTTLTNIVMKVIRHAGITSRRVTLDDQARQQITNHFNAPRHCMPDEARSGEKVALKCCDLWVPLIVQSNRPTANTNMHVELISQNGHLIERPMLTWCKHAQYTVPA